MAAETVIVSAAAEAKPTPQIRQTAQNMAQRRDLGFICISSENDFLRITE
jgi:hypothetical protein